MARKNLKDVISQRTFLLDGAMGTQLFARGVEVSACTTYVCIDRPDIVADVHKAYYDAGSDAVITNTFGGNKYALGRHGLSDKMSDINTAAVEIARTAAGEDKYVLGGLGPSGEFLEPLGTLKAEDLNDAYVAQAKVLAAGSIDGFIIETMTALEELQIAIEAVKSVCGPLPIFASLAFEAAGEQFRTMMGIDVPTAVAKLVALGVDGVGFNCGKATMDEYVSLAATFVEAIGDSGPAIYAEPNAGLPELIDDKLAYKVTPEAFADELEKINDFGITILGGCCGTTPEHIRAVADKLKS